MSQLFVTKLWQVSKFVKGKILLRTTLAATLGMYERKGSSDRIGDVCERGKSPLTGFG